MIASGWPSASAPPVELERLVDRVPAGGGGDVDELLDVPAGGLGEVGGHVEAARHPRDVAHVQLARPDRYGYQSVRAGSHRCTWASTTRSGFGHRASASSSAHHLSERVVEPVGDRGAAEGDAADRVVGGCAVRTSLRRRPARRRTGRPPRGCTPGGRRARAGACRRPPTLTANGDDADRRWPAGRTGRAGPRPGPGCGRRRWWRR